MTKNVTFEYLIKNIYNLAEDLLIYATKKDWSLSDECLIVSEDEIEDDSVPIDDFHYIFGVYTLIDIVENLKGQKSNFSYEEALHSLKYYLKNDSFMEC